MEPPNKRRKMNSPALAAQEDFVSLGGDDDDGAFGNADNDADDQYQPFRASKEPRLDDRRQSGSRKTAYDPRNAKDRPKSKHVLPGHEPWILVRTKFRRRFVHNTLTKESLWRIPKDVLPGVLNLERLEKDGQERANNAQWAEQQLKKMRDESKAEEVNKAADDEGRARRRRSESLQREDEEALMAELAAQAEKGEEKDAREALQSVGEFQQRIQDAGLESDSEYEVVEVTDSEGEGEGENEGNERDGSGEGHDVEQNPQEEQNGPVEFGEDDIAYQLAAMGEDYGLDPEEYGAEYDGSWEEGVEGLPLSDEDAAYLFRDLLDDYHISPFTPWDKVIADESEGSILNDGRYSVLSNMRSRKEVFDAWARDKAAQLKEDRAAMAKHDPKIPYLTFLQEKGTPKLYWPEFKRKFKKEPEMNDRKLSDKDREKLYREHINRLKLPESSRKSDLHTLLKGVPLQALNSETTLDSLPEQVLSHLHFISLPPSVRDPIIESYLRKLPGPPRADDLSEEKRAEESKKREERRRREQALAEREKKVEEERRRAERDEARARRGLQEGERELDRAIAVSSSGLRSHLGN